MNGYNCPVFSAVRTCTQSGRKAIKQGIIASLVAICFSFLPPSVSAFFSENVIHQKCLISTPADLHAGGHAGTGNAIEEVSQ